MAGGSSFVWIRDASKDRTYGNPPKSVYGGSASLAQGDLLYNNHAEPIRYTVASVSGDTLTIAPYVTITTPFETIEIPQGTTLSGITLTKMPGASITNVQQVTALNPYASTTKRIVLDKYIYGNQVVDLNNTVFNSNATLSPLYNLNMVPSFSVSTSISSYTQSGGAGTVDHYNCKGAPYDSNVYAAEVVYNVSGWSNRYEAVGCYSCGINHTASGIVASRSIYKNNVLFKTLTGTTRSIDITQSEYTNFPSSGTIRLDVTYSTPTSVTNNGYVWTAAARSSLNSDGYGFDWSCAPAS